MRWQLTELRRTYLEAAEGTSGDVASALADRFALIDRLTGADLADLKDMSADFESLLDTAQRALDLHDDARANATLDAVGKAAGLPGAPYSGVCGSRRHKVSAMFTARSVLETAEGAFPVADRAGNQVALAAGFGGNTSAVCIVTGTILAAARYVHETLAFCDTDIDSSEIGGACLRLRECSAWMDTPASHGGEASFVLDVVAGVIADARALGSVPAARLATAQAALSTAREISRSTALDATGMRRALILAYAEATPSGLDRTPVSGN